MNFDENKNLIWNKVIPSSEGFEFYVKKKLCLVSRGQTKRRISNHTME